MSKNDNIEPVSTHLDEKDRDIVDHIEHDTEKGRSWKANTQLDEAARILAESGGHRSFTDEEKRRVLRKVDIFVCIPMCITYFIQQVSTSSPRAPPLILEPETDSRHLARQVVRLLCRRIRPSRSDKPPGNRVLVAHIRRIRRSTHLPTLVRLRFNRFPCKVLGHV